MVGGLMYLLDTNIFLELLLDFDDACQYTVAERYGPTIVSFDTDFDPTERGRKTPKDVLEG